MNEVALIVVIGVLTIIEIYAIYRLEVRLIEVEDKIVRYCRCKCD